MRWALTDVRVWNGVGKELDPKPCTIWIDRGKIRSISSAADRPVGETVVSRAGCVVIPGLIDAHVHLDLDPEIGSPDEQLAIDPARRADAVGKRARSMLRAGITTARDLGGGAGLEIELRNRIALGQAAGPRLLCAGQPLTTPAGHCHFWGGEARDATQVAAVIERQLRRGVDWIKVMATGGVFTKGSGTRTVQFDETMLREVVALASRAGRSVAAHCHGTEGIANAARAGVRTIEHCSFVGEEGFGSDLDPGVVELLASPSLYVSPTVNAGWGRHLGPEGEKNPFYRRMSEALRALRSAGVSLIASTDAGIPGVRHDRLPEALGVFARYADLAPVDVLRSATHDAARALGLEQICGALAPGLSADLIVLAGNPLEDLACLMQPVEVVARGRRTSAG